MKKRVLHVVFGVLSGGVEQMLINYFSDGIFKEYDLYIAYSGIPDELCLKKLESIGFKTIQIDCKPNEDRLRYFKCLCKIIKQYKINILHTHINLENYLPVLAAKFSGVKVIISHSHGIPDKASSNIKQRFRKIKFFIISKYSTLKFACSKKAGDYLFGNNEYHIIYNSIDIDKFKYNNFIRTELRKKLKINDKEVIGYIGRFNKEKNHFFLLDVFAEISKENKNAFLILIGMGVLQKQIENRIKDLNLSNKVLIIPPKDNIYDYYQVMDLFVFPSKEEGLGMVAIESQINNLYCIASTGVPEETKISKKIEYLDLNIGSKKWADKIINKLHNRDNDKVQNTNFDDYDINIQREKLKKYYDIYFN